MYKTKKNPKVSRIIHEAIILIFCFLGSFIMNAAGIIASQSPALEMATHLHVVLLVALVIYGAVLILRVIYILITRFWIRR